MFGFDMDDFTSFLWRFTESWHFRLPLFWISCWTLCEVAAAKVWPLRQSCKKVSLLHCIVAFVLSSSWLAYHYVKAGYSFKDVVLTDYEFPGTFEHHIVSISMSYFIVDMPFCLAFHRTFIVHHLLCIMAFGAIQGYLRYWPFNKDFMDWESAPKIAPSQLKRYVSSFFGGDPRELENSGNEIQMLIGGFNGVFNLWMAELGGLFFHINRAFQGTDLDIPSRCVFLMMFTFTRCYLWPLYIRALYVETYSKQSVYHIIGATLETGLFLTNLHFLWTNIGPIFKTGRLMPRKPKYYHREWLNKHPFWKRVASQVVPEEKLDLSSSYTESEDFDNKDDKKKVR